jgi:hypothetical protein
MQCLPRRRTIADCGPRGTPITWRRQNPSLPRFLSTLISKSVSLAFVNQSFLLAIERYIWMYIYVYVYRESETQRQWERERERDFAKCVGGTGARDNLTTMWQQERRSLASGANQLLNYLSFHSQVLIGSFSRNWFLRDDGCVPQ